MTASTLGADIQAWRARLGLTRAEAAEALGLQPSTMAGYIVGRPCALEPTVRKLMAALERASGRPCA